MDPFAPLRDKFVRGLNARFQTMRNCLLRGDRQGLELEVHKLRGAAGVFGFQPLSEAAARMEDELVSGATHGSEWVHDQIHGLETLAEQLCATAGKDGSDDRAG